MVLAMSGDALLIAQAQSLLGVSGPLTPQALSAAFRVAVKAARPDFPGGNVDRFRQVIDAYHLLQNQPLALPAPRHSTPFTAPPPPRPTLVLTPLQALKGSEVQVKVGEKIMRVRLPFGIRTNDKVRLKATGDNGSDLLLPVLIRPGDDLTVLGADLFMDWKVPSRLIDDGGRIEIDTHAGPQHAWLVPDMQQPVRLCFKGLGLPGRSERPAGDLFVRLVASDEQPSAAADMLKRFTQVWTPNPLAA